MQHYSTADAYLLATIQSHMLKADRFWNGPRAQPSQGGAKLPTGGNISPSDKLDDEARERLLVPPKGSSRSGVIPEPTVTVRMEEKGSNSLQCAHA